jgi:Putative mono-oxygenase ydhR
LSYTTSKEETMRVQIITFQLDGIDNEAYRGMCDELAPAFAAVPGLESKLWLADRDANTYGGVYVFSDADAQATFAGSDLFAAVAGNPNLTEMTSSVFDVLAGPTAVTHGDLLAAEDASA